MPSQDDRRREDDAAREAHKKLTRQELQDQYDKAKKVVADGKDRTGYFEREQQRLREEMAKRPGAQPKVQPGD